MVIYLAGPMSGLPAFNFPAFDEAAEKLRGMGFTVISPAELDEEPIRKNALASEHGSLADIPGEAGTRFRLLSRDIRIVAGESCQGVIALPGWEKSAGANLEIFTALSLGKWARQYPCLERITLEGKTLAVGGTIATSDD